MEDTSLSSPVPSPDDSTPTSYIASEYEAQRGTTTVGQSRLRQVWPRLKRRAPLVFGVAIATTALAGVWIWRQTPIYQGKFRLLMTLALPQQSVGNQPLWGDGGAGDGNRDLGTQMVILQSPQLLDPLLKQLQKSDPGLSYDTLMGLDRPAFLRPPLTIEPLPGTQILEVTYRNGDRQRIETVLKQLSERYLQYSLGQRQARLKQGIDFIQGQIPALREQIQSRQTKLLEFQRKHNLLDPNLRAQELSNQFAALQTDYLTTEASSREVASLYAALQSQLKINPQQAIALNTLVSSPRYQGLLTQLQQVEAQLALQAGSSAQETATRQGLRQRRERLMALLRQTAQSELGNQFTGPTTRTPLGQPGGLQLSLSQQYIQTANQLIVLRAKQGILQQQLTAIQKQLQALPVLAQQFVNLQRNVDLATDNLNRFLDAQAHLQIEAAQQIPPWQLISPPQVGDRPVSPQPLKTLSLALISGLLLGSIAALLWEALHPVLPDVEEVQKMTPFPLLGRIPWEKDLQRVENVLGVNLAPLILVNGDRQPNGSRARSKRPHSHSSSFLEAFRALHTSIGLLGSGQGATSLTIVAAQAGEGKSTIAFHLAQASAAMGKRVLLVDCNLHHSQIHALFNVLNNQGLTNILATGLAASRAIQRVPQWETLSVLTAGDLPPDPARLINSQRMQSLVASLEDGTDYDLVIYDTPAWGEYPDARLLSTLTGGVILTFQPGRTNRAVFDRMVTELRVHRIPVLGMIANGVKTETNLASIPEDYGYAGG